MKESIMIPVKLLSIKEQGDDMHCVLCDKDFNDYTEHIVMRCEGLLAERNHMWDELLDGISIHAEVSLFNMSDETILDILLGRQWNYLQDDSDSSAFYKRVSKFARCALDTLSNALA